jgi:hypothetical protein
VSNVGAVGAVGVVDGAVGIVGIVGGEEDSQVTVAASGWLQISPSVRSKYKPSGQ